MMLGGFSWSLNKLAQDQSLLPLFVTFAKNIFVKRSLFINIKIYYITVHIITCNSLHHNGGDNHKYNFQPNITTFKTTPKHRKTGNYHLKPKGFILNNLALLIYVASVVNAQTKAITDINNIIQNVK